MKKTRKCKPQLTAVFSLLIIINSPGCSFSSSSPPKSGEPDRATEHSSPFADIHLHYNWDQEEIIDAETVVERLKRENIVLGVVFSTPTENALKIKQAGGKGIIPLFSPYITPPHRQSWYLDRGRDRPSSPWGRARTATSPGERAMLSEAAAG